MLYIPQAIREGWSKDRLAKEAGICETTARDVLAQVSASIATKSQQELGLIATQMQQAAAKERPAVVQRLQRVGKVADTLIAKVEQLVALIDPEEVAEELEIDDKSGRQRAPVPIESRLGALATALKAASAASKDAWTCFKDASGLQFAEDQARAKLKDDAKTPAAMVPGILVELDDQGQR